VERLLLPSETFYPFKISFIIIVFNFGNNVFGVFSYVSFPIAEVEGEVGTDSFSNRQGVGSPIICRSILGYIFWYDVFLGNNFFLKIQQFTLPVPVV